MIRYSYIILFLFLPVLLFSQDKKVAFGFQIEPIIPSALFRITTDEVRVDDILFTSDPEPGVAFGAILSFNISPRFSLETGISQLSRKYRVSVFDDDLSESLQFSVLNFEMPLTMTYYVRLGRNIYMGHSAGVTAQFLPSHLKNNITVRDPSNGQELYAFQQVSLRKWFMMPAFKGGIGWEYRTPENGTFYIGPTYRLFSVLYNTELSYSRGNQPITQIRIKPIGDYFGITIRYVFPSTDLLQREKNNDKSAR